MTFGKFLFSGALCLFATTGAHAADFSFSGSLSNTGEVQLIDFDIGAGPMRAVTLSYAGGLAHDGLLVSNGGFDPIIWLFDNTGAYLDEDDDSRGVPDPDNLIAYDSLLDLLLGAGTYTLAVSRFGTFANGDLSDGFTTFDTDGFFRTPDWHLDLFGPTEARLGDVIQAEVGQVPIPASLPLLAAGLIGLGVVRRTV